MFPCSSNNAGVADVSAQVHADVVLEMNRPRESLAQTQSALEAAQTRLKVLKQQQTRMESNKCLDLYLAACDTVALFGASASTFTWLGSRYSLSMLTRCVRNLRGKFTV